MSVLDKITEGNNLIKDFMELEVHPGFDHLYRKKGYSLYSRLQFDTSWNELMPAVEKAAKVYDEDNAPPSKGDVLISNLMMSLQTFNKLEIFNCLVEFITFRNSNK